MPARFNVLSSLALIFLMASGLILPLIPSADSASPAHICAYPSAWATTPDDGAAAKADGTGVEQYNPNGGWAIRTTGFFNPDYSYAAQENLVIPTGTIVDMWIGMIFKADHNAIAHFNGTAGKSIEMQIEFYYETGTPGSDWPTPWDSVDMYRTGFMPVSAFPGISKGNYIEYQWHIFAQDVWEAPAWNASWLLEYSLYIGVTSLNWTNDDEGLTFDYLGIYYAWVEDINFQPSMGEYQPLMMGLIWLLIVFLPPIAMNSSIPFIGFGGGLILMTVLLGIADTGFLPVTVIAISAVAIMYYKGDL